MGKRLSDHIRSNVWGIAAMFVALSGTAYATHPGGANTIDSGDIINSEVKTNDIGTGEVLTGDIAFDAVTTGRILNDDVTSVDLRDETTPGGGLVAADLRAGSVQSSEVADDSLGGGDINENDLFNDNSLTGEDIDEATLGTVPNAGTVSGNVVRQIDYRALNCANGCPLNPLALNGLTLRASCNIDGDVTLTATTDRTADDQAQIQATVLSAGGEPSTYDFRNDDSFVSGQFPAFGLVGTPDDDTIVTFNYFHEFGPGVTGVISTEERPAPSNIRCQVAGYAIG